MTQTYTKYRALTWRWRLTITLNVQFGAFLIIGKQQRNGITFNRSFNRIIPNEYKYSVSRSNIMKLNKNSIASYLRYHYDIIPTNQKKNANVMMMHFTYLQFNKKKKTKFLDVLLHLNSIVLHIPSHHSPIWINIDFHWRLRLNI